MKLEVNEKTGQELPKPPSRMIEEGTRKGIAYRKTRWRLDVAVKSLKIIVIQ